nr:hypothetical protein Iba_chr07cCG3410 [Ipomoea batatas]
MLPTGFCRLETSRDLGFAFSRDWVLRNQSDWFRFQSRTGFAKQSTGSDSSRGLVFAKPVRLDSLSSRGLVFAKPVRKFFASQSATGLRNQSPTGKESGEGENRKERSYTRKKGCATIENIEPECGEVLKRLSTSSPSSEPGRQLTVLKTKPVTGEADAERQSGDSG